MIADPVTRPSLPQCLLPCTDCTCSLFLVTNIIVTISTSTSAYQPQSYHSVHATCYQQPLLSFILYFGKSLSTSMTFVCFSLTVHMCVWVNVIPRNIKEKFLVVSAGSGSLLFNNIWTLGLFPLSIVSRAVCSSTADTTLLCSSSVGCGWVVCPMCTLSLSTHCCQHFYRSSNILPVYFVNDMIIFIQSIILSTMHGREREPTLLPAKRFAHLLPKPIQTLAGFLLKDHWYVLFWLSQCDVVMSDPYYEMRETTGKHIGSK